MERLMKNKILLALVVVLCVFGLYGVYKSLSGGVSQEFGAITPTQSARYTLFTTSTLTTGYTGAGAVSSTNIFGKHLSNIAIGGSYVPKSHGSVLQILVERSLDNGVTYKPYNVLEVQNDEILVHTSGTAGMPFTIPGSGTAASGTTIGFDFDLTMIADYIRISAKETTTSTAGTVTAQINLQSD